jgi:O-acetyl-ADP-ribose deacetylase (regulator of RNase III)
MIRFTTGNLLEAEAEALVNTVNTVGVMGKGIALMFKESFPENFKAYALACEKGEVKLGKMFVTHRSDLLGPEWIINFPTKQHWRYPSKLKWIEEGLDDLKRVVRERNIRSIALPPLGAGNGGLEWSDVRALVERSLSELSDVDVLVFEPTRKYQNVARRSGAEKLTPARALIADIIRRYWVLGIECTLLEVQKLAWLLECAIRDRGLADPMKLQFKANWYGPYADNLRHLLDGLDGSYLHCEKRIGDAGPLDVIWFDDSKKDKIDAYLTSPEAKPYRVALQATTEIIDGFESPMGMELLATVDWLTRRQGVRLTLDDVVEGIRNWPAGQDAAKRKLKIFDRRLLRLAIDRLSETRDAQHAH